jgi:putative ATPase
MTINLAAIITFFRYTRKVKKVTTLSEISLFSGADADFEPLANRVRPRNLTEFAGANNNWLVPGKVLRELIEHDQIPSMIFWGPPGVGKTTLASIIAQQTQG